MKDQEKKKQPKKTDKPASEDAGKTTARLHDENGNFAKGHKKIGGRQMGTKNRNGNVRDRLKEQIEPFIDNICENLIRVQKEEGTAAMLALQEKFMPYFMPKYSSMAIGAEHESTVSEEERLRELDALYTKKELSINFKTMIVVDNDKPKGGDFDPDEDPDFDLSQFDNLIDDND